MENQIEYLFHQFTDLNVFCLLVFLSTRIPLLREIIDFDIINSMWKMFRNVNRMKTVGLFYLLVERKKVPSNDAHYIAVMSKR